MEIKKYKTERVDSGAMVHGPNRPIGVYYTRPIEEDKDTAFCDHLGKKFYFNYSEVEKLFLMIIGKSSNDLFSVPCNVAIKFNNGWELEYFFLLAPKYWEIGDNTYFWSTESGNSRQADKKEVVEMFKKICPASVLFQNADYVMYSIGSPKGQDRLFGVKSVLYNKTFNRIEFLDSLPEEYLVDQFSAKSWPGNWGHVDAEGKHYYDGSKRRWLT